MIANYLKQDTLYLPLQTTRERVVWQADNRCNRLVRKDHGDGDDPAMLTIIAIISNDGFFLTPDAYYKGGTQITPSLADVELSCLLRRPIDATLGNEFSSALANIVWLMEQVRTPGLARTGVTMPVGSVNPVALKLRHVLFKVSIFRIRYTAVHYLPQEIDAATVVLPHGMQIQNDRTSVFSLHIQALLPRFRSRIGLS